MLMYLLNPMENYIKVAVNAPLDTTLTYKFSSDVEIGSVVETPLGRRKTKGVVFKKADLDSEDLKPESIKSIASVEENLKVPKDHLKWIEWISDYYQYPIGLVANLMFPPLGKKKPSKKELLNGKQEIHDKESLKNFTLKKVKLNETQTSCLKQIKTEGFHVNLLHGVTGSGKTEIYMEVFEKKINEGLQGLFLLPEISLTPQLEKRFKERFGDLVSIYHSQMTPRQKTNSWYDFYEGRTKIFLGPRSALFTPTKKVGVIVIDEEHESSFKQEEKFLYNARDAAIKLAHIKNIPIILGSATPSLESLKNAFDSKYTYIRNLKKVFNQKPPEVLVVDMTKDKNEPFWLSHELKSKIENHLARKKQVALFLNRRGWSSYVQCYACGHNFICPNCDVTLTLHKSNELFCHYCSYGEKLPKKCPECLEEKISKMGLGTERVEADIKGLFPTKEVFRFDRDEVSTKNQLIEAISKIENNEVDIIIGTQMIAKGLDFSNLTLMGILDADLALSIPDFRSTEKGLQQLLQVLGRVGRRENQEAEVVIQTRSPEHMVFQNLLETDYEEFAKVQLEQRGKFTYPPFNRMVSFLIKAQSQKTGNELSFVVARLCRQLQEKWPKYESMSVLGPANAPLEKIRNEYRFQVILKFGQNQPHQPFLKQIKSTLGKLPPKTKLSINVDPIDLM